MNQNTTSAGNRQHTGRNTVSASIKCALCEEQVTWESGPVNLA